MTSPDPAFVRELAAPQLNPVSAGRSNHLGTTGTSDAELVQRFKKGEENSFDELVRRYRQRIYALVYRLVRDAEDATELTQDVFVRAYRALPGFREKSSFYTWLYRIGVNLSFNRLRARGRNRVRAVTEISLDEEIVENLPGRDEPQLDHRRKEMGDAIRQAVDELPKRQRAVFIMRQYQGLRNDEIAQVLGLSLGAVKAHYSFAIERMRGLLKDWEHEVPKRNA